MGMSCFACNLSGCLQKDQDAFKEGRRTGLSPARRAAKKNKGYWSRYYETGESAWPMAVRSLGFNRTPPNAKNPMLKHPWHHWMDADIGRSLPTLTLVHVIRGSGEFSSKESGKLDVPSGSLIFAFPNVRHSYFCKKEIGWEDEWVEVEAAAILPVLAKVGVTSEKPVVRLGDSPRLLRQFRRLFDYARLETGEGCLAACAYETIVTALEELKGTRSTASAVENMQMRLGGDVTAILPSVATATAATGRSASWMRTAFRRETGLSPKRYQLQQRLNRAADLLRSTERPISEIAAQVGFCSLAAFSNGFSREFGCSPSFFRKRR